MSFILSKDGVVLFFTPLVHNPALVKTRSIGAGGAGRWSGQMVKSRLAKKLLKIIKFID
jgi:hypothetical protein